MKALIRFIIIGFILLLLVMCTNEGGENPVIKRSKIIYTDMKMYGGSENGAKHILPSEDKENITNKDSLYQYIVEYVYFKNSGIKFASLNNISFEFVGDNHELLSFNNGRNIILSTYEFREDSLFILQRGKEETKKDSYVFVAVRNKDGQSYFRTHSAQRYIHRGTEEGDVSKDTIEDVSDKILNIDTALDFAGIKDSASMKNVHDTILWCNVKYIYQ